MEDTFFKLLQDSFRTNYQNQWYKSIGYCPKFDYDPGPDLSDELVFGPHYYSLGFDEIDEFTAAYDTFESTILSKGWRRLGSGRHRTTFEAPDGGRVIKVSKVPMGVKANLFELYFARKGKMMTYLFEDKIQSHPIPKVYGHARIGRLSILCVERVERVQFYDDEYLDPVSLPKGQEWLAIVDDDGYGPQVGHTKDGRLVCFDWAVF